MLWHRVWVEEKGESSLASRQQVPLQGWEGGCRGFSAAKPLSLPRCREMRARGSQTEGGNQRHSQSPATGRAQEHPMPLLEPSSSRPSPLPRSPVFACVPPRASAEKLRQGRREEGANPQREVPGWKSQLGVRGTPRHPCSEKNCLSCCPSLLALTRAFWFVRGWGGSPTTPFSLVWTSTLRMCGRLARSSSTLSNVRYLPSSDHAAALELESDRVGSAARPSRSCGLCPGA